MPRAKKSESTTSSSDSKTANKKPKTKPKTTTKAKAPVKKTTAKKTASKKTETKKTSKAKPVFIDVISDDELEKDTFFSDESLNDSHQEFDEAKDFFLDLNKEDLKEVVENDGELTEEQVEEMEKTGMSREEVDKQKEFFSNLVHEMKEKQASAVPADTSKKTYQNRKSTRLYRSLIWKFLILVGFLAAVVFYFSFSKLTILITPEVEAMNDTLFLKVANQTNEEARSGDARTQVPGSINELDIEFEKTYQASGEEYVGEDIVGTVKIVNNNNRSQALVATTRLLSPDNKLFRIKEAVNVPAGEEVEVEIYADSISRGMAIAPTRFTIPGLWVGLQDDIYARSDEAFEYTQKMQKYIKASDIQFAKSELYDLVLTKAKETRPEIGSDKVIYKVIEPMEVELLEEAGDKVDEFVVNVKAKVIVVSFSGEEVERLAGTKLKVLVPDDKELAEFNPDNLSYILENYDEDEKVATVKATFSGLMILKNDADVIEKENLVNLKAEQIKTYLKDYREIGDYELHFYPPFIERAPHLVDRIDIKIKK